MRPTASLSLRALGLLLCGSALAACGAPFTLRTPTGFAEVQTPSWSRFRYRAIAAYGLALGVRAEDNAAHGDLDFWTEAVDRTIRQNGLHFPTGTAEARAANGLRGRRLEYRYGERERGMRYVVLVFVTRERVYVVEAGGAEEAMTRGRAALEEALASFSTQ